MKFGHLTSNIEEQRHFKIFNFTGKEDTIAIPVRLGPENIRSSIHVLYFSKIEKPSRNFQREASLCDDSDIFLSLFRNNNSIANFHCWSKA